MECRFIDFVTTVICCWCTFGKAYAEDPTPPPIDCKQQRLTAAQLSATCCYLTRPHLDKGYVECAAEQQKKVPAGHKLTATDKMVLNMCTEECNFIGNGYSDAEPPFKLDKDNIRDNLNKFMPAPRDTSLDFMLKAYQVCESFLKHHALRLDIKFPSVDWMTDTCYPYPMQITACVRMYAMQGCPKIFYRQTKECLEAKVYFQTCIVPITEDE